MRKKQDKVGFSLGVVDLCMCMIWDDLGIVEEELMVSIKGKEKKRKGMNQ